jgi:hypothetical protein
MMVDGVVCSLVLSMVGHQWDARIIFFMHILGLCSGGAFIVKIVYDKSIYYGG